MKKFTLLFAMMLSIGSFAQITLDFDVPLSPIVSVKLSNSVVKYMNCTLDSIYTKGRFRLLNSDGSVYKEVFLPPNPNYASGLAEVDYVTTTLFDSDSTSIEYLVTYQCDSINDVNHYYYFHTVIANENGVVLLNEKYASTYTFTATSYKPIVQVGTHSKLILWYSYSSGYEYFLSSKIFNLPGHLPSGTNDAKDASSNGLSIYPNPNNGNFYILSKSFENNINTLDLYSLNGKLIETYRSAGNPVQVSDQKIGNGIYLITPRGATGKGSRVVIQK